MVVRVRILAEHPLQDERRVCTTGYFSMVAIGRDGAKARPVPELLLLDDEAHAEHALGAEIAQAIAARRAG